MTDYMELAYSRVERAWEHIEEFKRETTLFLETKPKPYSIVAKENQNVVSKEVSYHFKVDRSPPIKLRIIMGDAIHNLGAALDNIVWGFGQIHGASPNMRLTFPIYTKPRKFEKHVHRSLKKLPTDTQSIISIIKELQPYARRDNPKQHPLYILHELWIIDKHKIPITIDVVGHGISLSVRGSVGIGGGTIISGETSYNGSKIMTISFTDEQSKVNLNTNSLIDIVLEKGGVAEGISAYVLLVKLHNFVRYEVIAKLEPFFV